VLFAIDLHLGEWKAKNKHGQEIRVEKDILPAPGKENVILCPPNKAWKYV
jgi:hypothetical protein